MARLGRADVFSPDEVAIGHVMSRVVRRCLLLGDDPVYGKSFDHRKLWIEKLLQRLSACKGIDVLCFSILSNHFHLVLRSRPDVVGTWLIICPIRKATDGEAQDPSGAELAGIRNDPDCSASIRAPI